MGITDELREWMRAHHVLIGGMADLIAIVDRIDAKHEKQVNDLNANLAKAVSSVSDAFSSGFDAGFASTDDWIAQNEKAMLDHGWVSLPIDIDNIPIHVGDVLESTYEGKTYVRTVDCLIWDGDRWDYEFEGEDGDTRDVADMSDFYRNTRHRKPTTIDVLHEYYAMREEMGERKYCIGDDARMAWDNQLYELDGEFASKLRLAESDDA